MRAERHFVAAPRRESRRVAATLRWLGTLLRFSIAFMWLIAGAVSLGAYPVERSVALLQRIGIAAGFAPAVLAGASILDLALGVASLAPRRPRWIWTLQIAVVLSYTLIISVKLPALWLEPFGAIAKNVPILVALLLLRQIETRR